MNDCCCGRRYRACWWIVVGFLTEVRGFFPVISIQTGCLADMFPGHWVDSSRNVMAHGDAREGKWRWNWRMELLAGTLHTTLEHDLSSITTADEHTSAARRSRRFKWTRPFRRKTKSRFCVCAITFQSTSTRNCVALQLFSYWYCKSGIRTVDSSWNVMAHSDAREGMWRGNLRMQWVASTLHTSSEHGVSSITTITTADAHTSADSSRLNWRPPADLNGIVRFAERRNLVSARVPSHFNWPLQTAFRWSQRSRPEASYLLLHNTEDKNTWRCASSAPYILLTRC